MDNITPPPIDRPRHQPSLWFWLSSASVALSYLIGVILFLFVVPVIAGMFAELGAELPTATQSIVGLSEFLKAYFLFMQLPVLGLVALSIWAIYALDQRKQILAVILIGNLPPLLVLILLLPLFLPILQLFKR